MKKKKLAKIGVQDVDVILDRLQYRLTGRMPLRFDDTDSELREHFFDSEEEQGFSTDDVLDQ